MASFPLWRHFPRLKLIENAAVGVSNAGSRRLMTNNSFNNCGPVLWRSPCCFSNSGGARGKQFKVFAERLEGLSMLISCRTCSSRGGEGVKVAASNNEQGRCDTCVYGCERKDLVSLVLCQKCGALRSTSDLKEVPSYFEILGLNRGYRVDVQAMANKAKQLQKKFHPDLYSQKGPEQQDLSQEYSSLINKALTTLSDPISRGRYLLLLSGLSEEAAADLEKSITTDPRFLEEVMELNERLEEITSEQDWKDFRSQNAETMRQIQIDLEKAFDVNDVKEAQRLLGRMKYFDTLQHKLKELQSRIGIVE